MRRRHDLLPTRLEFYESWLNPSGLRDGRIGLAPLAAVLSFLRQEGDSYRLIVGRAGEYTAEWTVSDMPGYQRAIIRAAPPASAASCSGAGMTRTYPCARPH